MSSHQGHMITTHLCSNVQVPSSWNIKEKLDFYEFKAPEGDLEIYFFEQESKKSEEEQIIEAWYKIDPTFSRKLKSFLIAPPEPGWDKTFSAEFEVSAAESQFIGAVLRKLRDWSYLFLFKGSLEGLSRRGADAQFIVTSFTPKSFQKQSLKEAKVKVWDEENRKDFTDFIETTRKIFDVPGVSIAIIDRSGNQVYQGNFGVKSIKTKEPVTADTPFMIGSTSKALTSLMIAHLVDKGRVTWEKHLADLLPGFRIKDPELTHKLTLRDSFSASTGLPRKDLDWILNKTSSPEEFLQRMQFLTPTAKEGETFQYSNALYMAGGYAGARAYQKEGPLSEAYRNAIHAEVFNPLEMKRTVLSNQEAQALGAAEPHSWNENGELVEMPLAIEEVLEPVLPAGGIWSTVEDMGKYMTMELNGGTLLDQEYISRESLLERRKPMVKVTAELAYGLGLMLENKQDIEIIHHGGNTLGFSSDMFFLPHHGLGVVVLTNKRSATAFTTLLRQRFLELTFELGKSISQEMLPSLRDLHRKFMGDLAEGVSFVAKDLAPIQKMLGKYRNDEIGEVELQEAKNGTFRMVSKQWSYSLGIKNDIDQTIILVLKEPPSNLAFRFIVQKDSSLLLNEGSTKYRFEKF